MLTFGKGDNSLHDTFVDITQSNKRGKRTISIYGLNSLHSGYSLMRATANGADSPRDQETDESVMSVIECTFAFIYFVSFLLFPFLPFNYFLSVYYRQFNVSPSRCIFMFHPYFHIFFSSSRLFLSLSFFPLLLLHSSDLLSVLFKPKNC